MVASFSSGAPSATLPRDGISVIAQGPERQVLGGWTISTVCLAKMQRLMLDRQVWGVVASSSTATGGEVSCLWAAGAAHPLRRKRTSKSRIFLMRSTWTFLTRASSPHGTKIPHLPGGKAASHPASGPPRFCRKSISKGLTRSGCSACTKWPQPAIGSTRSEGA